MTREDKRRAIEEYCYTSSGGCDVCPLGSIVTENENCFSNDDLPVDIDRNYKILFGEVTEVTEVTEENPYWERITALAKRQREKGMSKYGQGLDDNPSDIIKRIEHLQEELIDGLMYCEWIKDKLSKGGESIE